MITHYLGQIWEGELEKNSLFNVYKALQIPK